MNSGRLQNYSIVSQRSNANALMGDCVCALTLDGSTLILSIAPAVASFRSCRVAAPSNEINTTSRNIFRCIHKYVIWGCDIFLL